MIQKIQYFFDEIEGQSASVTGQAVADIVQEVPAKARGPRKEGTWSPQDIL